MVWLANKVYSDDVTVDCMGSNSLNEPIYVRYCVMHMKPDLVLPWVCLECKHSMIVSCLPNAEQ